MRRGTVRIAASQALALEFLPREIAAYRARFPFVHFDVRVLDHIRAMHSLADYEVDLVLVFRPPYLPNFRPLMSFEQRLVAMMPVEPSARRQTQRAAARLRALSGGSGRAGNRRPPIARRGAGAAQSALRYRRAVEFVRIPAPSGDARQCDLVPDRHRRLIRRSARHRHPRHRRSATRRAPISCSDN